MTDTTPTPEDITAAAGELYALVPPATTIIGDLSPTWPMLAGHLQTVISDDRFDSDDRIRRARAAILAMPHLHERLAAEAAREREASRQPGSGTHTSSTLIAVHTRTLIDRIKAGGFDWLIAVHDAGQAFECGVCGDRVRAFEDDQAARAAARKHLLDEHLDGITEMERTVVVSADLIEAIEDDDRCQPIGCDAGHHLPGCRYIVRERHGCDSHPEVHRHLPDCEYSETDTTVGELALQGLGLTRPSLPQPGRRYGCDSHPEGHLTENGAAACVSDGESGS